MLACAQAVTVSRQWHARSVLEDVLLPQPEDFPDAEERRLLYVALTRAKHQVWLLQDREHPSVFVEQLHHLGVPLQKKP